MPIPLLFLGDSPSLPTGLARIGRDLATQAARLPQFKVGFLGRGGIADCRLPFMQYTFTPSSDDQWGADILPDVWANFAGKERGAIFTIWDPSRLTWFGKPLDMGPRYAALYEFLCSSAFERWGYFAIDSLGPREGGALPALLARTLSGYDRLLAYMPFGAEVLAATLPDRAAEIEWLPHGLGKQFTPRDREESRQVMAAIRGRTIDSRTRIVGCVMANQPRKDWGVWASAMRVVLAAQPDTLLWCHTDVVDRYWDLRILADCYGLANNIILTTDTASDEDMSYRYSACDLTVLPSQGEGFGYPIAESLGCGVPVMHTAYGGGAELIPDTPEFARCLVRPTGWRLDTRYAVVRPVLDPDSWAENVITWLRLLDQQGKGEQGAGLPPQPTRGECAAAVEHLRWRKLWPAVWERWFLRGAERLLATETESR